MSQDALEEAILVGIKSKEKFFTKLYEKFTVLSHVLMQEGGADVSGAYRDFEKDLDECMIQTKRTIKVFEAAERDEQIHKRIQAQKEAEVKQIKEEIEQLKVELEQARQDRKNHEEHVAFAKKVREFPSRAQSTEDIERTRAEIEQLDADRKALEEKATIRAKQLQLTFFSIQQLLAEIDLDKKDEDNLTNEASTQVVSGAAPAASSSSAMDVDS